eukprot:g5518.t1
MASAAEVKVDVDGARMGGGRRSSLFQPKNDKFKLLVGTWNVGNAQPDEEQLKSWLPEGGGDFEMIVVGVQECSYKTSDDNTKEEMDKMLDEYIEDCDQLVGPNQSGRELNKLMDGAESKEGGGAPAAGAAAGGPGGERKRRSSVDQIVGNVVSEADDAAAAAQKVKMEKMAAAKQVRDEKSSAHFVRVVELILGLSYKRIDMVHGGPMRILCFARKNIAEIIDHVETASEYTGIAHVGFNKGGLVIKVQVAGTTLCFVSNHLAAHQEKVGRRNGDCMEIISGAKVGNKALDIVSQFHHVFWFGDLNYRIHMPMIDGREREKEEHWREVVALVEKKDFATLLKGDQLKHALKNGDCLAHFVEGELDFPPTYKLDERPGFVYTEHKFRPPAWCDRVLWRSMPGLADTLRLTRWAPCPEVHTSDHKPCRAEFEVTIHEKAVVGTFADNECPVLHFSSLGGTDLVIADISTSDPYITFFSDPAGLLGEAAAKKPPNTKTIANTTNPVWKEEDIPLLRLHSDSKDELAKTHVMLAIYDADRFSQNDPMGTVVLPLRDLIKACGAGKFGEIDFDEAVIFKGQSVKTGRLTGHVKIAFPGELEYDQIVSTKHRDKPGGAGCCQIS